MSPERTARWIGGRGIPLLVGLVVLYEVIWILLDPYNPWLGF
ncbi:MAG: hypothetical protein ABIH03_07030 [Pseudomonadota bacterium]